MIFEWKCQTLSCENQFERISWRGTKIKLKSEIKKIKKNVEKAETNYGWLCNFSKITLHDKSDSLKISGVISFSFYKVFN